MDEIASNGLQPTIVDQAFAAAVMYPELTIRCPWCGSSVPGKEFDQHGKSHQSKATRLTAIILAGGKGSRLAPWVAPKCLMPINGVTILQRLMKHLTQSGVDKIVICVGYRGNDIRNSVVEHGWDPKMVLFSDAGEDAPMGERLLEARKLTDQGRVLICYGDEMADVDIKNLIDFHSTLRCEATFMAHESSIPGGTVKNDMIIENQKRLVHIGFVVADPESWPYLKPTDGVSDWLNRTPCHCCCHYGRRATINTLGDLKYAEEVWK